MPCVFYHHEHRFMATLSQGNVVEVRKVMSPGLRPLCHGTFDEGELVCVGGLYEWPCDHLTFMQDINE